MLPALLLLLAADPGPLACPTPTLDRGTVKTGRPLTFAFPLVNPGPAAVALTGFDTGCNCAKPEASVRELPPGGTSTVSVVVNTLTPPAGPNRWRVGVRYRAAGDPADRTLELVAVATLVREVAVTPPAVAVSTAGPATLTLTVTDTRPTAAEVNAAATDNPHLTAAVGRGERRADGTFAQPITLSVSAALPPGRHAATLVLTTADPDVPELRVPVTVDRRSPQEVRAYPAEVETAAGGTVAVQLRRTGGRPLVSVTVDSDHPAVSAVGRSDGAVTTVWVAVRPDAAAGEATVRVRLAQPPGQTVAIPVRWTRP
jgi:hypothetical protein